MSETWLRSGDPRVTLHVLRLLAAQGEGSPKAQATEPASAVLREAMEDADREHFRVLEEVPEAFYHGVATPSVRPIDPQAANRLRASLRLCEDAVGVWGPRTVRRGNAVYKVWIRLHLCG